MSPDGQQMLALPIGAVLLVVAAREWRAREDRIAKTDGILPMNGVNRFRLTAGPVVLALLAALLTFAGLVAVIRSTI